MSSLSKGTEEVTLTRWKRPHYLWFRANTPTFDDSLLKVGGWPRHV